MKIDEYHREAGASVGLRIPAIVEVIAHAALRAAVDDEGHRVLLALFVAGRLDHVAVDFVVVPALERKLLVVTELDVRQAFGVELGDGFGFAGTADAVDLRRRIEVIHRQHDLPGAHVEIADRTILAQGADALAGDVHRKEPMLAEVVGRGVERLAVRRNL